MVGNIVKQWKTIAGSDNWKGLLEPLDIDLRRSLLIYGRWPRQPTTPSTERRYEIRQQMPVRQRRPVREGGSGEWEPYKYTVTKFLYATSRAPVPDGFVTKSLSREEWSRQSNWIGYVAVATDEGKEVLGRRGVVVVWTGTVQSLESGNDFYFTLVSASPVVGVKSNDPQVHQGCLSIYSSDDPRSPFTKSNARDQVLSEIRRVLKEYKDEEVSICITGHSLGAALLTLNALDIAANGYNKPRSDPNRSFPVTAFV